jgi:hypothetical protein
MLIDELGPVGFVERALASAQEAAEDNFLVYLSVYDAERLRRSYQRDEVDTRIIQRAMLDPMEINVPRLEIYADIVASKGSIDFITRELLEELRKKGWLEDYSANMPC